MKQIIVLIAMIILGILIFNIIAGSDENSILSLLKGVWGNELAVRTRIP